MTITNNCLKPCTNIPTVHTRSVKPRKAHYPHQNWNKNKQPDQSTNENPGSLHELGNVFSYLNEAVQSILHQKKKESYFIDKFKPQLNRES